MMKDYLKKDIGTVLPSYINEKNLITFESNFESGNLDSVYLVNENEYNLVMKVDTNTKGNTFWFNFIVYPARSEQVVTFNIINFTRDMA